MDELNETTVNWEEVDGPKDFLKKENIKEPMTAILLESKKSKPKVSKNGKLYSDYTLKVRLDDYSEKYIGFVMPNNMDWLGKKIIPVTILIDVVKQGDYTNWSLKCLEAQKKLKV